MHVSPAGTGHLFFHVIGVPVLGGATSWMLCDGA